MKNVKVNVEMTVARSGLGGFESSAFPAAGTGKSGARRSVFGVARLLCLFILLREVTGSRYKFSAQSRNQHCGRESERATYCRLLRNQRCRESAFLVKLLLYGSRGIRMREKSSRCLQCHPNVSDLRGNFA